MRQGWISPEAPVKEATDSFTARDTEETNPCTQELRKMRIYCPIRQSHTPLLKDGF